jgi:hypothetical protein
VVDDDPCLLKPALGNRPNGNSSSAPPVGHEDFVQGSMEWFAGGSFNSNLKLQDEKISALECGNSHC